MHHTSRRCARSCAGGKQKQLPSTAIQVHFSRPIEQDPVPSEGHRRVGSTSALSAQQHQQLAGPWARRSSRMVPGPYYQKSSEYICTCFCCPSNTMCQGEHNSLCYPRYLGMLHCKQTCPHEHVTSTNCLAAAVGCKLLPGACRNAELATPAGSNNKSITVRSNVDASGNRFVAQCWYPVLVTPLRSSCCSTALLSAAHGSFIQTSANICTKSVTADGAILPCTGPVSAAGIVRMKFAAPAKKLFTAHHHNLYLPAVDAIG